MEFKTTPKHFHMKLGADTTLRSVVAGLLKTRNLKIWTMLAQSFFSIILDSLPPALLCVNECVIA